MSVLRRLACCCLSLGLATAAARAGEPARLRLVVNRALEMPLAKITTAADGQPRLEDGLILDIRDMLAERLGQPIRVDIRGRKHIPAALSGGQADIYCFAIPDWLSDVPDLAWSEPFVEVREHIAFRRRDTRAPSTLSQLYLERIGTVRSYVYPQLEPLFHSGKLRREDANTEEQLVARLMAKRIDMIVLRDLSQRYLWNRGQAYRDITLSRFSLQTIAGRCAVSWHSAVPADRVVRALNELIAGGAITRRLSRYLVPGPEVSP